MTVLDAQGDLLIERVPDIPISGATIDPTPDGAFVLAEGEASGHRHVIYDRVTMFRDDGLARDIPSGLYVSHVRVDAPSPEQMACAGGLSDMERHLPQCRR